MEMIQSNKMDSLITTETYNSICNLVFDYIIGFNSSEENIQRNYTLKRDHINRVIGYTEVICRSLECETDSFFIAQLTALLHDIGRFEQFKHYQTFNDQLSEDHAILSVKIIKEMGWLKELKEEVQNFILKAVLNHNKLLIPKNENKEAVFYSKIIRDADKIDIFDLAVQEYSTKNKSKNKSFTLDLKDSFSVSEAVVKNIMAEKLPDKKDLRTITDFKLMQLSYVFDINFKKSFEIINQRQYLKHLFETLPKSDQVFEIYRKVKIHVENQILKK